MNRIKEYMNRNMRQYGMLIALLAIMILFGILTGGILISPRNVSMLVQQYAYVFVLAIGMMLCILTGGNIDLAAGSLVALVGAMSGLVYSTLHMPDWLAIILSIMTGLAAGMWQGFWIAFIKVPPFITTLSGSLIFRGLNNIILDGQTLQLRGLFVDIGNGSIPDIAPNSVRDFLHIGDLLQLQDRNEFLNVTALLIGLALSVAYVVFALLNRRKKKSRGYEVASLGSVIGKCVALFVIINIFAYWLAMEEGIPYLLVIVAVLFAIYTFITTKTIPGRHLYAMGGNIKAAQLSGVNTKKMMFLVYSNMGLVGAIGGIVTASRAMAASPIAGVNFELDAIGSCFIGGASAYGGIGTIWGAIVGGFIMGVMNNGMSILGWDVFMQNLFRGLVILLAVAFDVWSKSKSKIK